MKIHEMLELLYTTKTKVPSTPEKPFAPQFDNLKNTAYFFQVDSKAEHVTYQDGVWLQCRVVSICPTKAFRGKETYTVHLDVVDYVVVSLSFKYESDISLLFLAIQTSQSETRGVVLKCLPSKDVSVQKIGPYTENGLFKHSEVVKYQDRVALVHVTHSKSLNRIAKEAKVKVNPSAIPTFKQLSAQWVETDREQIYASLKTRT